MVSTILSMIELKLFVTVMLLKLGGSSVKIIIFYVYRVNKLTIFRRIWTEFQKLNVQQQNALGEGNIKRRFKEEEKIHILQQKMIR